MERTPLLNCPIVEATIDLNCEFVVPSEAVVGILYQVLTSQGHKDIKIKTLPLVNLPEDIRKNDSNLKYSPTHQIICEQGTVSVGSNILSFGCVLPYPGWEKFKNFFIDIYEKSNSKELLKSNPTVSLRYLNFFAINIFERLNLEISLHGEKFSEARSVFKTEVIKGENVFETLQITGGVHLTNKQLNINSNGSLIDIRVRNNSNDKSKLSNCLDTLHNIEEVSFFGLLKEDLIKELEG